MDTVDDTLLRFLLPAAGIRGITVRLGASWRTLASHGAADSASAGLLGQACAAAALLGGHVKIEGRLSIQLRGGPITTLFAECTAAGTLRGIVRLRENAGELPQDLRMLGEDALLAITIENPGLGGREPMRYQGLVQPESASLEQVLEAYFQQSEQLPTRLHLACDADSAAGILLQQLPHGENDVALDEDGYRRASALLDTLRTEELLNLAPREVVHRLFHEEAPQLLAEAALRFACSCSRDRVAEVLVTLGREEAAAAVEAGGGEAAVDCEFCGQHYAFDADEIARLFARQLMTVPARSSLQ